MNTQDNLCKTISEFYRHLDKSSLNDLATIYATNAVLKDPIGEHHGLATIESYFNELLSNCTYCRFDIHHCILNDGIAMMSWTMLYAHPRLRKGQDLSLEGCSVLHIQDEKIISQIDYYDLGQMLYEHIPLLRTIIAKLKKGLRS